MRLVASILLIAFVAGCAAQKQIVMPDVADTLLVQSSTVSVEPAALESLSLRGKSFEDQLEARIAETLAQKGSLGNRPVVVAVTVSSAQNIVSTRGQRASGTFTINDADTGALILGPLEYNAVGADGSSGGLIGVFVTAAVAQNERAFSNNVKGLGTLIGNEISALVFGR